MNNEIDTKGMEAFEKMAKEKDSDGRSGLCTGRFDAACTFCDKYWNCDALSSRATKNVIRDEEEDKTMSKKFKFKRKNKKYSDKGTAVGVSPDVYEMLKDMALETGMRMQDLADMYIRDGIENTEIED